MHMLCCEFRKQTPTRENENIQHSRPVQLHDAKLAFGWTTTLAVKLTSRFPEPILTDSRAVASPMPHNFRLIPPKKYSFSIVQSWRTSLMHFDLNQCSGSNQIQRKPCKLYFADLFTQPYSAGQVLRQSSSMPLYLIRLPRFVPLHWSRLCRINTSGYRQFLNLYSCNLEYRFSRTWEKDRRNGGNQNEAHFPEYKTVIPSRLASKMQATSEGRGSSSRFWILMVCPPHLRAQSRTCCMASLLYWQLFRSTPPIWWLGISC